MSFIESIKNRAKQDIKTIVLPESNDIRVIEAASIALSQKYANIILIGKEAEINELANNNGFDISNAEIIDPELFDKYEECVSTFYELRKEKGMTLEKARELMKDNVYFGMMMVKMGKADGLVSGACHSTSDTLRPALQILKTVTGTKLVSAFFVMVSPNKDLGEDGVFVFGDCGLNSNPNEEELSEIAISSAKSFKQLVGQESKIAMLSYSTYGSAPDTDLIVKVRNAMQLVKEKEPELLVDGELQLDAAIIPEVAKSKAPNSKVAGQANTLIFPDLNAGNIGYKLVQRFGNAEAYGPLCQGIARPVNDLSRGCNSNDIAGVIAITAVQAQTM